MSVLGVLKLLMFFVILDWSVGNKSCYEQLKYFGYIPKYACPVSTDLIVKYNDVTFGCGQTLNLLDAAKSPTVKYDFGPHCKFVTLVMIAPNFTLSPYLFDLVHNIPAKTFKSGFKSKAEENPLDDKASKEGDYGAKYIIPDFFAGIAGTENQTLIYIAYCQCYHIAERKIYNYEVIRTDRSFFDPKAYAEKYHLRNPVMLYHKFLATGLAAPTIVKAQLPIPN